MEIKYVTMNDIMDKERKQFEYDVVKIILSALNSGDITYTEAQTISKHLLLQFTATADIQPFLMALNEKWKIFGELSSRYSKQAQYSLEDASKLEKIKNQLTQLTQV